MREREKGERENKYFYFVILNDEKSWFCIMGFVFFKDGLLFMYIIFELLCSFVCLFFYLFIYI